MEFGSKRSIAEDSQWKAVGLVNILIEVLKCVWEIGKGWVAKLFNYLSVRYMNADEYLMSVHINKGDIQNFITYRGIRLERK